jgi:uncharacterized coiled-coil DUF342 family protein
MSDTVTTYQHSETTNSRKPMIMKGARRPEATTTTTTNTTVVAERKSTEKGSSKPILFPDHKKYEQEVEEIQKHIQQLNEQLSDVKKELVGMNQIKETFSPKLQVFQQQLTSIREKQKSTDKKKYDVMTRLKEATSLKEKQFEALQNMKAKLPYKSLEEMEHAILDLERQIETRKSLVEEKQLLNEISNVKKAKKSIAEYKEKLEELERDKQSSAELRATFKTLGEEATVLKRQAEEALRELNALKKEQDEEYKQFFNVISKRQEILEELNADYQKLRQLNQEIANKRTEHIKKVKEERAKRMEILRLNKEKTEEEHRLSEAVRQKELNQTPPFIDEIFRCNLLLSYLMRFSKDLPSPTTIPTATTTTTDTVTNFSVKLSHVTTSRETSSSSAEGADKILKKKSHRSQEEDPLYDRVMTRKLTSRLPKTVLCVIRSLRLKILFELPSILLPRWLMCLRPFQNCKLNVTTFRPNKRLLWKNVNGRRRNKIYLHLK